MSGPRPGQRHTTTPGRPSPSHPSLLLSAHHCSPLVDDDLVRVRRGPAQLVAQRPRLVGSHVLGLRRGGVDRCEERREEQGSRRKVELCAGIRALKEAE